MEAHNPPEICINKTDQSQITHLKSLTLKGSIYW